MRRCRMKSVGQRHRIWFLLKINSNDLGNITKVWQRQKEACYPLWKVDCWAKLEVISERKQVCAQAWRLRGHVHLNISGRWAGCGEVIWTDVVEEIMTNSGSLTWHRNSNITNIISCMMSHWRIFNSGVARKHLLIGFTLGHRELEKWYTSWKKKQGEVTLRLC